MNKNYALQSILADNEFLLICENYGGQDLHIPAKRTTKKATEIIGKVGYKTFSKIFNYAQGTSIYVPKLLSHKCAKRNEIIKNEFEQLLSQGHNVSFIVRTLAEKYNLSIRRIHGIRAE